MPCARPAHADEPAPREPTPHESAPSEPAPHEPAPRKLRLTWNPSWPRFRIWEYAATAGIGATSWYLRYHLMGVTPVKWQGDNFFDDAARSWLRADTPDGRTLADNISQDFSLMGYLYPFGIDLPVILLAHRDPALAWQVLMMDLEAFAVTGLVTNILFWKAGRGRPSTPDCNANPHYDPSCGMGDGSSFPSGHVVIIATAAGLTCVHHRYLPLYGDARADAGACALMLVATTATAVGRVMGDRHHATDTLTASALGLGGGYGLPWLLHYRRGSTAARLPVTLIPFSGAGQIGLGLFGLL
jgi:membrane-associated phospholipid phosphatase